MGTELFHEGRWTDIIKGIVAPRNFENAATDFDVLLTVHLSIFILVINQLGAQNLFYNKFIA